MLRFLIPFIFIFPTLAYSEGFTDYQDGAQGGINPSIPKILDRAKNDSIRLRDTLDIQKKGDYDFNFVNKNSLSDILNSDRVKELLSINTENIDVNSRVDNSPLKDGNAYIFVSFSIPSSSLKKILEEAKSYKIQVVFQGFVNNSVLETQSALETVFGKDERNYIGFSIDPTLFNRFSVKSVPQLVITSERLTPCTERGCAGEVLPPYDVVKGNIPVSYALELISKNNGDASSNAAILVNGLD